MASALTQRSEIVRRSKRLRRRQRRLRLFLWLAIILLIVAELTWFAHQDPLLIREVRVSGATSELTSRIRTVINRELAGDYLGLLPRSNIWFYPRKWLIKILTDSVPEISEIKIGRAEANSLLVSIKERLAAYLWCDQTGSACYTLDQTGLAFAPAPQFSGHPFFEFYGQLPNPPLGLRPLPSEIFQQVIMFRAGLNEVLSSSVLPLTSYRLLLDKPTEWRFLLHNLAVDDVNNDVILFADNHQSLKNLLTNFHSALTAPLFVKQYEENAGAGRSLEYLDLRFLGKVFYKFKS